MGKRSRRETVAAGEENVTVKRRKKGGEREGVKMERMGGEKTKNKGNCLDLAEEEGKVKCSEKQRREVIAGEYEGLGGKSANSIPRRW